MTMLYDNGTTTVYGLCPGCQAWQVDVSEKVLGEIVAAERYPRVVASTPEALQVVASEVARRKDAVLEEVLREHADECPRLAEILEREDRW